MKAATLTGQQEAQWIDMARKGDLSAFNQLVLAYQDLLFRIALRMLADEDCAADTVQAVFQVAYREIGNYREGNFRGWLLKRLHTACADQLRRRKLHPWFPPVLPDGDGEATEMAPETVPGGFPERALVQHDEWERVERCLRELPKPMLEVMILIDCEELDYEETAMALGIPPRIVKSRLAQARARLGKILPGDLQKLRGIAIACD